MSTESVHSGGWATSAEPYEKGAQNAPGAVRLVSYSGSIHNASGPIRGGNLEPALTEPSDYDGGTALSSLLATPMPVSPHELRGHRIAVAEELLLEARQAQREARDLRVRAVTQARGARMTWAEIARLLGTSAPAARSAHERAIR
jgi:hypothetical protein